MTNSQPLVRPVNGRMIAGVCAAVGGRFGIDPTLTRVLWVLLTLCGAAGIIAYLVCWLVIPSE